MQKIIECILYEKYTKYENYSASFNIWQVK